MNSWKEKLSIVMYKEQFAVLVKTADLKKNEEWFNANKMFMAFAIEFFYQKPFNELSLQEFLEGYCSMAKLSNMFTRITCSDDGDHYTLKMYHEYGLNGSRYILLPVEILFNLYGVKFKKTVSERSLFVNVYKNEMAKLRIRPVPGTS
jgi:hypothetical protein